MPPSCSICRDLNKSYANNLDEREGFWHRGTSADLVRSAEKGCGSCRLLLQGIRTFKSDWETLGGTGKGRNRVDFRFYGRDEGVDLSVLFRAQAIDELGHEGARLSETLLEFYELRGKYYYLTVLVLFISTGECIIFETTPLGQRA